MLNDWEMKGRYVSVDHMMSATNLTGSWRLGATNCVLVQGEMMPPVLVVGENWEWQPTYADTPCISWVFAVECFFPAIEIYRFYYM